MEITTQSIINVLNELAVCDKDAIENLLKTKTTCNETLAYHKTCQVGVDNGIINVGLLGIINAIVGISGDKIASVWDNDGKLINFIKFNG